MLFNQYEKSGWAGKANPLSRCVLSSGLPEQMVRVDVANKAAMLHAAQIVDFMSIRTVIQARFLGALRNGIAA
jgi:hypothetical protein